MWFPRRVTITVFLLDDHEIVRRGLRELLEMSGDIEVVGESGSALEAERRIPAPVSYTHLRAHETVLDLVCRLLLAKKKQTCSVEMLMCFFFATHYAQCRH